MSSQVDRRIFLGGLAAAGVATVLNNDGVRAAPSEKVVVGVMGMSRGRALAASFARQPNVEVKYVCDVDQQRADDGAKVVLGAANYAPQAITDFRRMLDDKSVDAVINATPNHWHAPGTILACAAGKHVYVEKPCSHNPAEGELMVQAARHHKRAVQMGSQRRSSPGTREAMQRLREGVIGKVYLARSWYTSPRESIGHGKPAAVPPQLDYDLWQGPAPRVPYIDNRIPYNWHWFWHWGNGELGNNGVHTLDLCRWGLGVDFPVRVTSSGGRYCYDDDQETPDTHTVCYEFASGQAMTWEGLSCHRHSSGFVKFYGTKGALDLESNGSYVIFDEKDVEVERQRSSSQGDIEHIVDFLTAIRNDTPLRLNAEIEEGHKSTLLCHLGNIAHRTGRALRCDPEQGGRFVEDPEAMQMWQREYEPGWEPKI